jgi:hypothetical protein
VAIYNFFVNFDLIEQMTNRNQAAMEHYQSAAQTLMEISSRFSEGGFLGEAGTLMNALLSRDMRMILQYYETLLHANTAMGETMREIQDAQAQLQQMMPF